MPKPLVFNKAILPQNLSNDEKMKHNFYTQRYTDEVNTQNFRSMLKSHTIIIHTQIFKKNKLKI